MIWHQPVLRSVYPCFHFSLSHYISFSLSINSQREGEKMGILCKAFTSRSKNHNNNNNKKKTTTTTEFPQKRSQYDSQTGDLFTIRTSIFLSSSPLKAKWSDWSFRPKRNSIFEAKKWFWITAENWLKRSNGRSRPQAIDSSMRWPIITPQKIRWVGWVGWVVGVPQRQSVYIDGKYVVGKTEERFVHL